MTPEESRQVFGDTITGKYFTGTDYVDVTYRYNGVYTISSVSSVDTYENVFSGRQCLCYFATSISPSANIDYITFDIQPQYSIFNTSQIHSFIALNGGGSVSSTFQSPSWDWVCNGSSMHLEHSALASSGYRASVHIGSDYCTFVPFDYRSQNTFSGYSLRATFFGNTSRNGVSMIFIGLPYVDVDASGAQGTFANSSSGGDINVSVDVDMSETNGLLGTLIDAVEGVGSFIINGLKSLFVPEEGLIDSFYNTLLNLFYEVFAPYQEVHGLLDQLQEDLLSNSAMETVTFPAVSVPNTDFSFGPYQVPLKPAAGQMADFYATLRTMFNVLATILVVNMLITRVKAILVGEQVVEVEEIDDY